MDTQTFAGFVRSGGTAGTQPVARARVMLYEATADAPRRIGEAGTDAAGRFSFDIPHASTDTIFFATAHVDDRVLLAAVVGPQIHGEIVINELTTVAAAFSMAQFANGAEIGGNAFGLRIAAGMNDNLVDVCTGHSSPVLLAPPNADQTNALRSTRSLANLVAACVRGMHGIQERFFQLTTPPQGSAPGDTFQALLNVARNPASNAGALFNQALGVPAVYAPALFSAPDAWTLAVKVNDSGDDDYLFGGPANIAFDRRGYAWISNNVFQGTPNSGNFIVVLQPDGKPARGGDRLPVSPVLGGGLKGPGWGVTVAPNGHAWVGNFGWGDPTTEIPKHGSVSEFLHDGTPVSGEHGHQEGALHRAQAVVADADGNIWMASFQNGRVVVYLGGNPHEHRSAPAGEGTFGVSIARDGTVWVSAGGGGLGWPTVSEGSVSRFRLEGGELVPLQAQPVAVGNANKAIAVDSLGNAWLASGGDSSVYQVTPDASSPDGLAITAYTGVGGMDAPWGICVDGDDHVWVGNFGVLGLESDYTYAGLTRLAGANPATRPAGLNPGDPLSPPTGYTLPSAGEPVLLRNGQPVYRDGTECYSPLMRMTSCQIDQAGNVWVVNNWKPRFRTDFEADTGNPGGDGVVIFVGLAPPPRTDREVGALLPLGG
jgi:streptogramin lyase